MHNVKSHLVVLHVFQNAIHVTSFYVTEKYQFLLKIDMYKDGCYLKYIFFFGGRQVCLCVRLSLFVSLSRSLSYSQLCVCSVNIHDACFNLYFVTVS